jgi:hypothetical protein
LENKTLRRKKVKVLPVISKRSLVVLGILACFITISAVAQDRHEQDSPVMRTTYQGETHTGKCCSTWDATVTIEETAKPRPIIVTFSTDYRANAPMYIAMRLNDGPCAFYGPGIVPAYNPEDFSWSAKTFQWVILPGDYKLAKGLNTIKVCGGGINSDSDQIELGFNTLTARLQDK